MPSERPSFKHFAATRWRPATAAGIAVVITGALVVPGLAGGAAKKDTRTATGISGGSSASKRGPRGKTGKTGKPGPRGVAGGPGAQGPAGTRSGGTPTKIPRTTLELGAPTGGLSRQTAVLNNANLPDEGGTTKDLLTVNGLTIRAVCKTVTNGDQDAPSDPFTQDFQFDEDGDEAKILVYGESGTLSFQGQTGPRKNVPAGAGTASNDTTQDSGSNSAGDPFGSGEGKHQLIAVSRDPQQGAPENDWEAAFKAHGGFIASSTGAELIVNLYAGIDVFGVGDKCVFGGDVIVLPTS